MLGIRDNYQEIDWEEIEEKHFNYCWDKFEDNIGKLTEGDKNEKVINYILDNYRSKVEFKKLITENMPTLIEIALDYVSNFPYIPKSEETKKNQELVRKLMNYELFSSYKKTIWCGYKLSSLLNINVCPYCNRQYTTTISPDDTNNKTRPQFDHFSPKSIYPILQLSLYNLVPSCPTCNQMKSSNDILDKNTEEVKYLYPYTDSFGDVGKFTWYPNSSNNPGIFISEDSITVKLNIVEKGKNAGLIKNNVKLFALEEIYNKAHKDTVLELIAKERLLPGSYLESIKKIFNDSNISNADIYRLVIGNYYKDRELGNRPLSKLTRDIAEELGLLDGFLDKDDR
jgi:hypothetical protein